MWQTSEIAAFADFTLLSHSSCPSRLAAAAAARLPMLTALRRVGSSDSGITCLSALDHVRGAEAAERGEGGQSNRRAKHKGDGAEQSCEGGGGRSSAWSGSALPDARMSALTHSSAVERERDHTGQSRLLPASPRSSRFIAAEAEAASIHALPHQPEPSGIFPGHPRAERWMEWILRHSELSRALDMQIRRIAALDATHDPTESCKSARDASAC